MSSANSEGQEQASKETDVAQPVPDATSSQQVENGTKRPRSNSLEAAAAQALTQLDGPAHLRQQAPPQPQQSQPAQAQQQPQQPQQPQQQVPIAGFQPTLGPPQPMHPSQYANAFSAGQNVAPQQPAQVPQQQPQQSSPQQAQVHDPNYAGMPMSQSPAFRPNTGLGSAGGSPAGGRAPGSHQARQRTAVACRYCRKRKIRCTGISHDPNDPRCSNCRRLDQECIYAPVGAPQGNYTRQPMPDAYGRGQPFQPMPQPGMMQGHPQQWQGYPQPGPYMHYAPHGRGMPVGPDGQPQQPQPGQPMQQQIQFAPGQYGPAPGYPQGQHYQYDSSYPNYVNDPNAGAGGPQGQGQFGRLKPETFAVYTSPTAAAAAAANNNNADPAATPSSAAPVVEAASEKATKATKSNGDQVPKDDANNPVVEDPAATAAQGTPAPTAAADAAVKSNPTAPETTEQSEEMLAIAPELMEPQADEVPESGTTNGKEEVAAQPAKVDDDVVLDPAILQQSEEVEKATVDDGQISQLLEVNEADATEAPAVDAQALEAA